MDFKKDFKKLYNRVRRNAFFQAFIIALIIAFAVLALVSLYLWIANKKFWISFIPFTITLTIATLVFYMIYKPNDKSFAVKLDEIGLQQRVVTMNQFKDDDSLMARIQRENAKEHIEKVDKNKIRLVTPLALIIILSVMIVLGTTATTVSALSNAGVIGEGGEVIGEIIPGIIKEYEVEYDVEGSGYIEGEMFQIVKEGQDASGVIAEAFEGWYFEKWSDGVTDIYREDLNVNEDISVTAIFKMIDLTDMNNQSGGDQDGVPTEEELQDRPIPDPENGSGGQDDMGGDQKPDGSGNGAGRGQNEANNQVIDGETFYGDSTFDAAYGDAMDGVSSDGDLAGEIGEIIGDYFGVIAK